MHTEQYAVVKECGSYRFSIFHETLEEAKAEAIRLAEKEQSKFLVLKMVGFADKKQIPVEWRDF